MAISKETHDLIAHTDKIAAEVIEAHGFLAVPALLGALAQIAVANGRGYIFRDSLAMAEAMTIGLEIARKGAMQ